MDSFNKDKEGISVLLCVDILNEGVHVDDIDGIFMLRRTISPIIYFQQIGRALSFSGRKKQIKIFDLVNNFNNHMAIDMIYQEIHEEFEKRIQDHPEDRERYDAFVSNKQFEKLLQLNIVLPEKISMTMEERQELLNGYNSIQEKAKSEYSDCITDVILFIEKNNKLPELTSEDEEEKNLAKRYLYGINNIDIKQNEELKQVCIRQKVKLNAWDEKINKNDLKVLFVKNEICRKRTISYILSKYRKNNNINEFMIELIEFMQQHEGQYPSLYSEDENEKSLAKQFIMYKEDEKTAQRFNLLEKDKDNKLYNPQSIMYKLTLERKKQNETKLVILRCVEFLQKYGRRPLPNSNNQDESQLAIEYESKCIKELGNAEITMLNNMFNNRKNLR